MTRTCTKCGKEFALPLHPGPLANALAGIERRGALCSTCRSTLATKAYYKTDKGKKKRYALDTKYREKKNISTAAWRKRNPERVKELDRQCRYDLNPEQFKALCEHDKVCAVCKREVELHTDHNHETKQVRGRLCVRCNTAIGKLGDDLVGIMRAVRYLEARDNVTGLPWQ